MTRHKTHDHTRDPCPYNIVSDVGVGFCMGAMGGALWHSFKGYRNSPRGERWSGAVSAVKARAPILGGSFAVWSGLFNASDCLIADVRNKEDLWNPILAGASTGAILAARRGPSAMAISAVFGGVILAAMEGIGAMIGKMNGGQYQPVAPPLPAAPPTSANEPNASAEKDDASQQANGGIFRSKFGYS